MTAKTCIACGGIFTPARRNRMTCSDACRRAHDNAVKRRYDATPARVKARQNREQAARDARPVRMVKCPHCEETFEAKTAARVYCSRVCSKRAAPKPMRQTGPLSVECAHCRVTFQAKTAGKVYCSRDCINQAAAARNPTPMFFECVRCSKPLENPRRGHRFCGPTCRKANHMDKIRGECAELDGAGEIIVAELEEAPRRLAVAKLFDRFECEGIFDHFAPAQWINPANRRAGR